MESEQGLGMLGLTEFQKNAVIIAIRKMYKDQDWFDITTVNNILEMTGKHMVSEDLKALNLLHCVHWGNMGQDMMRESFNMIMRALDTPALDFEAMDKELKKILGKKTNFLGTKMLN